MIGTTVGSYCVTQKVSIGGMGTVYKAEHVLIGKQAAVKVLHPELCNNREIVNRFFNEAKATTQIKHPGIVEVFDFGYLPSGDAYIVMEFLEGESLARRMKLRGRMEEGEAAMLLKSMCSALGAAHAKHIVHRDLKPDNIFLVPDPDAATGERPKLLDFGIAKLTDIGPAGSGTKTGAVMGTPTYMSPEQCKGAGTVDLRADLYSLGCIYYELLCGRPPFTAEGAGELIGAHILTPPDSPRKYLPSISALSEKLILSLLAKNPDERPQSAKELAQRLSAIATKQGWITNTSPTGVTTRDFEEVVTPTPSHPPSVVPEMLATDPTLASDPGLSTPEPPARTMWPTTLSGAASSMIDVPRSGRGKWIAAVGAVVLTGAVVGFLAVRKSVDSKEAPAKQPEATMAPIPQPAPTPVAQPTPTPVAQPTPTPVAQPTPAARPATPIAQTKPTPVAAVQKPPTAKTTPPIKKAVTKPVKPDKAKGHTLIETDI